MPAENLISGAASFFKSSAVNRASEYVANMPLWAVITIVSACSIMGVCACYQAKLFNCYPSNQNTDESTPIRDSILSKPSEVELLTQAEEGRSTVVNTASADTTSTDPVADPVAGLSASC
jgi:hypothetical protein